MEKGNFVFSQVNMDEAKEEGYSGASYLGIFSKTMFFLVLAVIGALTAIPLFDQPDTLISLLIGSAIGVLIFGLIATVGRGLVTAIFGSLYALGEGLLLGTITAICEAEFPGIALAAILCTGGVFATMLVLYLTGVLKGGRRFQSFIISAFIGIIVTNIVILISGIWTNALINAFYGNGSFGLICSILVAIIAALSLIPDFRQASNIVEQEASKDYEWKGAFALTVGIIYLYIRILRILMIIYSNVKKD